MQFLNRFLRTLKPYKLASHKIWSVSPEKRESILKLDWNESTIPPSPQVHKRLVELLEEPDIFHLYPSTYNPELIHEIARYIHTSESHIQYFASSDSLHEYICKLFVAAGDPVIILGPTYDNFRLTCQANGARVYFSEYNPDFTFDSKRFEGDITSIFPALVYICNPNNPTGYCHSLEYIKHLLETFPDVLFLLDEAYSEFSGITATPLVEGHDNIIISKTMSKAFALANFRFGYVVAPEKTIELLNRVRNPKNITTFTQEAALAALRDKEYMWDYVRKVNSAKEWFFASIKEIGHIHPIPSKGNFVLLQMRSMEEKKALMEHLEKNQIYTRDTSQSPLVYNCFRITIGTQPQMVTVLDCIKQFYKEYGED